MSGLLMRGRRPLAMMISASQVSHQLHALKAPVGVRNALVYGSPGVHHFTSHWPTVAAVSGETCSTACRYAGAIGASERKSSPVVMIAQAMRANLLASATVTSRAGRRCKSLLVQTARGSVLLWSQRELAVAPRTRRRRRYGLPCLVILPSLSFPPLEFRCGTRPSHAAKSRPERNMEGSGTCAARAALISANARDGFERLGRRALALPGLDLLVD